MENHAVNSSVSAISAQPQKWRALLDQFENVLALNIFMTDPDGRVLISLSEGAKRGDFGAGFLQKTFAFQAEAGGNGILVNFKQGETHLQTADPFELHAFAVPVAPGNESDKPHFYLVVGPIVLNKPWPDTQYMALAEQLTLADPDFLKNIHAVQQMSTSAVSAILDLLGQVVKDVLEMELEKQKLHILQAGKEVVRPEIINAAEDIFATIHQDELLIAVLDSAIKMAQAEGGSIMIFDEEKQELVIRVSRGLENKKNIMQARTKIGEGIAGLAAQGKIPLYIYGTDGDAQLRPFLKRPEIKKAIVIPLVVEDKVIGVLNLRTKSEEDKVILEHIAQDVRQLSRFIATALNNL